MALTLTKTVSFGGSQTGLVGTVGVELLNPDGTTHTARATAGIYEIGGGIYGKQIGFDDDWTGSILWDTGGGTPVYATDEYSYYENNPAVDTILVDTNELQTDWANGGRLDLILDACAIESTVAALNNISNADVNTQVADVMKTDTIAEMPQQAPPATPTFEEAINYIYRKLRNKTETTATEDAVYDDAGTTKLFKTTISDDTITFAKQEYVSG